MAAIEDQTNNGVNRKTFWWFAALSMIFAFAVSFYIQIPFLTDKIAYHGDIRQEIYWMAQMEDPSLFPNDFLAAYSSNMAPLGLKTFYKIMTFFFDPLLISKFLGIILCPIFALLFYLLCYKSNAGPYASFFGVVFSVMIFWSKSTAPFAVGDSEDFVPLLIAAFLLAWIMEKPIWTALVIFFSALFYPPVMVIFILAISFSYLKLNANIVFGRLEEGRTIIYAICFVISAIIVFGKYLISDFSPGPVFTKNIMIHMPEFFENGRAPMFYGSIWKSISNIRSGLSLDRGTIYAMAVFAVLFILSPKNIFFRVKQKMWLFTAASCCLFVAAHLLMLHLFSPSRYLRLPIPIIIAYATALSLEPLFDRISWPFEKVTWVKPLIIVGLFCPAIAFAWAPLVSNDYLYFENSGLYQAISSLPKNTLIAAHPFTADNIPIRTKRSVYICDEMALPYFQGYYKEISRRLTTLFSAYYSPDIDDIYKFCNQEGVTHFLMYQGHFSAEKLHGVHHYREPYNDKIIDDIRTAKGRFAACTPPKNKIKFINKSYILFECSDK